MTQSPPRAAGGMETETTSKEVLTVVVDDNDNDDDDDDNEAVPRRTRTAPLVVYDLVHSPSYQVPVLYVTIENLPFAGLPSLDLAYDLLVPAEYKMQLKAVGVLGSLSMAEHLMTGSPAYFVHPCRTAEAMGPVVSRGGLKPEEYLLAWIGMVGASVGLNVPAAMAQRITARPLGL